MTNGSLAHNVHRLLSENYFKSYKTFSSTLKGPGQDPKENLSLEMLHNNIHVCIPLNHKLTKLTTASNGLVAVAEVW